MVNPCILVVDDDQGECLVTKRLLTDEGDNVDAAYDAARRTAYRKTRFC
jgi:CheY-like chemotaxis protein